MTINEKNNVIVIVAAPQNGWGWGGGGGWGRKAEKRRVCFK